MTSALDYSTTAASNTAIGGVGVAGTDTPSNLDNAIRQMAADIANAQPRAVLKNASYAAIKDDFGKTFVFSGASRVLTIPAISSLATGWFIYAEAPAGDPLTINRSGSNTLNGLTSLTLVAGRRCRIFVSQSSTDLKVEFASFKAAVELDVANTWTAKQTIREVTIDPTGLGSASGLQVKQAGDTNSGRIFVESATKTWSAYVNEGNGNLILSFGGTYGSSSGSSMMQLSSTGNLTLTGVLDIASGGTGAATAAGARTALGLGTAATRDTGTSGANVPLLNGNNTYSGSSTFSGSATFTGVNNFELSSSNPTILLTDTDTNSLCRISGNSTTGSITIAADQNNTVAGSGIVMTVDGNTVATINAAGDLTLTGSMGVSSGGTGATTAQVARANLGVDFYSGTSATASDLPINSYVLVNSLGTVNRNATVAVYIDAGGSLLYTTASAGNTQLTGTWRSRGLFSTGGGAYVVLAQRVA